MNKEAARSIISITFEMGKKFDDILQIIENEFDDLEMKGKYLTVVQDLIGHICFDLVMPIVDLYPDLNPDKKD